MSLIPSLPHAIHAALPDLPSGFRLHWEEGGRCCRANWAHPQRVDADEALQARVATAATAWAAATSAALGAPLRAMHAHIRMRRPSERTTRLPDLAGAVADALLTQPDLPWDAGDDRIDAVIAISVLGPGCLHADCTPWKDYASCHPVDPASPWRDHVEPAAAAARRWAERHRRRIDALGLCRFVLAIPVTRPSRHQRMAAFARQSASRAPALAA